MSYFFISNYNNDLISALTVSTTNVFGVTTGNSNAYILGCTSYNSSSIDEANTIIRI